MAPDKPDTVLEAGSVRARIARVYAEALLAAALKQGGDAADAVGDELGGFVSGVLDANPTAAGTMRPITDSYGCASPMSSAHRRSVCRAGTPGIRTRPPACHAGRGASYSRSPTCACSVCRTSPSRTLWRKVRPAGNATAPSMALAKGVAPVSTIGALREHRS